MQDISLFALQQRNRAQTILGSQIQSLSRYSLSLSDLGQPFTGLVEAIRAGKSGLDSPTSIQESDRSTLLSALQKALSTTKEWQTLAHGDPVQQAIFSPDGQYIASVSDSGDTHAITLWTAQGEALRVLGHHEGRVTSLAFSPDGQSLASGNDNTIKLWAAHCDAPNQPCPMLLCHAVAD